MCLLVFQVLLDNICCLSFLVRSDAIASLGNNIILLWIIGGLHEFLQNIVDKTRRIKKEQFVTQLSLRAYLKNTGHASGTNKKASKITLLDCKKSQKIQNMH